MLQLFVFKCDLMTLNRAEVITQIHPPAHVAGLEQ